MPEAGSSSATVTGFSPPEVFASCAANSATARCVRSTAVAHDAFALDGERPVPGFEVVGIRYDRDFWIVGGAGGQTHACGKGQ